MTRFARPFGAARSLRSRSVQLATLLLGPSLGLAPTGPAHALFKIVPGNFVSNPGRASHPPADVQHADLPDGASLIRPTGCSSFVGRIRRLRGIRHIQHAKKKPVLSYELFLKYGGEGGIRTPDTLPYTHFPGVLLQPLGHLTILLFLCYRNGR